MIPEATLDQIQDRADIVEIISALVPLRRAGRNLKANCPFHQEKTPSFVVNPDKQIFHCFGCGAGGNVFSFLMKFEKKDFLEVVESLAERVGIEIPKEKNRDAASSERWELLLKTHRLAQEFYHQFLLKHQEASDAREYLEKRGLSQKTIEDFKIGFAPESWDTLTAALRKQFPESLLEKSGLVLPRKEGGFYDRFRKRIIFPILDAKGQCIAFGGRVMDDSVPKYLNSPETEIYVKGRHLYGLAQARSSIRELDAAIVVEGYMDVIGCVQAGVTNVVASLGTALTPDQVRLVKRQTQNVFILYDADKAGEMATQRGLELFLEEGMEIRIVRLPEGHDPDSYIRDAGIERFRAAMGAAQPLFDYRLALLKKQHGVATLDAKVKIANEMVKLFSRVRNEILVSAWTRALASELQLSETALQSETKKSKESAANHYLTAPRVPETRPVSQEIRPAERLLLGLLLERPDLLRLAGGSLTAEEFENASVKKTFSRLRELAQAGREATVAHLINVFGEDEETGRLLTSASAEAERVTEKEKAFEDCLTWMRRSRLHGQREELQTRILEAQKEGDHDRIRALMRDFGELNKGMKKSK